MDNGVITQLEIESPDTAAIEPDVKRDVKINGRSDPKNASITYKTIDIIRDRFKSENDFKLENMNLRINHEFQVPISTGFGTSAACALGTSLAIAKTLNLPLTLNEAASLAHLAEIEMKSGLGDVIAEITGGIVLRLKEGSPGIGRTDRIIHRGKSNERDLFVISKTLGEIETSKVIEDPFYKNRINQTGKNLLDELLKRPDPLNFLKLSRRFAEETGLMNSEVLEVVEVLDEETMGASMAMLGNTAFALSETPDTSVEGAIISKVHDFGCRFL